MLLRQPTCPKKLHENILLVREGSQYESSPEGPLVRRVLAVNGGAGGDLRLGVDGFRLCADLLCRMTIQYQINSTRLQHIKCNSRSRVKWCRSQYSLNAHKMFVLLD